MTAAATPARPDEPSPNPRRASVRRGQPTADPTPAAPTPPPATGEVHAPGGPQGPGGLAELLGLPAQPSTTPAKPDPVRHACRPPARQGPPDPAQDAAAGTEPAARLLHTPEQAAALLQIPASWLRKKAAAGLIPSTRVGRHLRFSQQDLDHIIRAGSRRPRRAT